MTTTDSVDLVQQALEALRLRPLRNALGMAVPSAVGSDGVIEAAAANTGRLVVAPGQTVASAWGNTVFDNSVICFASTADRDAQWPAPHNGSVCFTIDTGTFWQFGSSWVQRWVNYPIERVTNSGVRSDIATKAWVNVPMPASTKGHWTFPSGILTMAHSGTLFISSYVSYNLASAALSPFRVTHNGLLCGGGGSTNLGGGNLQGACVWSAPVSVGDTVQMQIQNMDAASSAFFTTTEVTYKGN